MVGPAGAQTCPSCGSLNSANADVCVQCGFELGLEEDLMDFEEFEDGAEDEGPEAEGFMEADLIDEEDDFQEVPRGRARAIPGPESIMDGRDRREGRGPPPMDRRGPPPRPGPPSARGGPRPQTMAPPKPAKPPKPVDPLKKREQVMQKYTLYLILIGGINAGMYYAMGFIMGGLRAGEMSFLGFLILDLVIAGIIIVLALNAGRWANKSPDRTTPIEAKNLGRINLGLAILLMIFLIQVFGVHRALPGIPDPGNYNSQWSILYVIIALPGIVLLIKGLYGMREKLSYYKVWKNGVWLLLLAPLTGALDDLSPAVLEYGRILNYQWYFAYSVATLFVISTFIAFSLQKYLNGLYKGLEDETKRGEDLFKAGRYREAMNHLDNAIDVGHDLFSQYFYDPENPRLAQQIRLPAQYGIPWLRKGDIFVQINKPRKAIAIFDVILELDPRNEVVWNRKGEVFISMDKYQEAIRCFDQALTAVPTYVKAIQNKQQAALLMRETELEKG